MALSESIGSYSEFNYTGGIQSVVIPADGIYMLECYGAQGGNTSYYSASALGGYSKGYKNLKKGTTIFVCVGGKGGTASGKTNASGGYNGGGSSKGSTTSDSVSGGGGATHMALVTGTLATIGNETFVDNEKGLIVAGGSGGCWYRGSGNYHGKGGYGGGSSGGTATDKNYSGGSNGGGGTQSSGGSGASAGSFGSGGTLTTGGGGGGGLYGGGSGNIAGGGGGSGYIGGVPEFTYNNVTYTPTTTSDQRSGHGYAKITYVALAKIYNLKWDGQEVERAYIDGVELEQICFDGVSVFGNP